VAKLNTYDVLGSDLALTRYSGVPSALPLSVADSWGSVDLQLVAVTQGSLPRDTGKADLGAVSGRANLAQALVLRLLTRQGALGELGHPDYGCRLTSLIGELNNDSTRNLARLFTIEAIKQEPRVRELLALEVNVVADQPDTLRIGFSVLPVNDDSPLALSLEVTL
jgi:phage baseplate assembly protein W